MQLMQTSLVTINSCTHQYRTSLETSQHTYAVSKAKLQPELDLARSSRAQEPSKVWVEWFTKVLVAGIVIETQICRNSDRCGIQAAGCFRNDKRIAAKRHKKHKNER